jgi:NTE family protein
MMDFSRRAIAMSPFFRDVTLPITSAISGRRVEKIAELAFGSTFIEDLWTPYFCTACDTSDFREVVFERGRLSDAALASVALPGVLPPRLFAGHMHVDGGTTDVLPGAVMRARCRGKLIAVDVSTERELVYPLERYPTSWSALWHRMRGARKNGPIPLTIVELFMRAVSFGVALRTAAVARDADVFLRPPVEHFGMTEFSAMDEIQRLGYEHARDRLATLSTR